MTTATAALTGADVIAPKKAGIIEPSVEDRQPKPAHKSRVQFDVSPRSLARLELLKEKTEASSYAEVVKNGLKLYDGLIEEIERGSEFLVRDKYGNVSPFKMFL